MREDLTDLQQKVDNGFQAIANEFQKIDNGFIQMRGRLDADAAGQQHIADMLSRLIAQQGGPAEDR